MDPEATQATLNELETLLGTRGLLREPEDLQRYGGDRSTRWQPAPLAVARPSDTGQIQAIVRIARHRGLPLVPSGGRTGLCGGAVAAQGELVLSLDRMNRILGFDPAGRALRVEAGVITAQIQTFATEQGLLYPVDFASAGSSQIGGNIATNAGGVRVIRYGMTRDRVSGLVVIDGRGELLDLNRGLIKNNTGPDLRHLFIGSEGILGIVAEATLQPERQPRPAQVLLFAVAHFDAILSLLEDYSKVSEINAFEFFSRNALEKVLSRSGGQEPTAIAPFYALLEIERRDASDEQAALEVFERHAAAGRVLDAVLASSVAQARELWALRERISETLAPWQPWKNDVSVRVARMGEFLVRARDLLERRCEGLEVVWYGHIGDGNVHINVLKPEHMPAVRFDARCESAGAEPAILLREFGGSISAEHGIGLAKRDYLGFSRSQAELGALRDLKRIFDPDGILNPGKVLRIRD